MKELSYKMAPLKAGQEDSNLTRMERWEEANGMSLSSLSQSEWLDVMEHILPMTRQEIEEWLTQLQAQRMLESI